MARIRTIKPELAKHELLYDLERETGLPIRFAWAMLPTVCDREGRFKWQPRTLKADILPHDELDFSRVLDAWLTRGQLVKYRVGTTWFGWVPTFGRHQVLNNREAASELPSIRDADEVIDQRTQALADASGTRASRVAHACPTESQSRKAEGKGREGKGREGEEAIPNGIAVVGEDAGDFKLNGHGMNGQKRGKPPCPHQEIVALYHELLPELPEVREWTSGRQRTLKARWDEKRERQNLDWWREYFTYVRTCDFLLGKIPGRSGKPFTGCNLEWLLTESKMINVIEGRYQGNAA